MTGQSSERLFLFALAKGANAMIIDDQFGGEYEIHYSERCSVLPGDPLPWFKLSDRTKARLRTLPFLRISTKRRDAPQGTAVILLPDPPSLWDLLDSGRWSEAMAEVKENEASLLDLTKWWEYARRSKEFQADCKRARKALAKDPSLALALFLGGTDILYQLRFTPLIHLHYIWDIPISWISSSTVYPFVWPDLSTVELAAAIRVACSDWNDFLSKLDLKMANDDQAFGRFLRISLPQNADPAEMGVNFHCACSRDEQLKILDAFIDSNLKPQNRRHDANGLTFTVPTPLKDHGEGPTATFKVVMKVSKIIQNAVGFPLPAVRSYDERNKKEHQTLQRELAALDGKKKLDAELWPNATGKGLNNQKSDARRRALDQIQLMESAANTRLNSSFTVLKDS
ncbi:MAG: hypothetical protein EA399_16105 [Desulfovibrionales bacterium]|nr:MAG: hypothetical protein EA399_16105 [Desulfovibrionales bacterium]